MSKKTVLKIGGSVLKNKESVVQILNILKSYKQKPVLVVSAFYGITNKLKQSLENLLSEENTLSRSFDEIREFKSSLIIDLIDNDKIRQNTLDDLSEQLKLLRQYLQGIYYIRHIPEKAYDYVLSFGEKLSALVLNGVFEDKNISSEIVCPEDAGLVTDGIFGNASIDLEASKKQVAATFNKDVVYLVPGFYGVSRKSEITLLGRGGTDYSAAAFAYCIDAESLDIWKDVNGFMSGDPKLIKNTRRIKHLTYSEAAELAYFGAGILHPRTVEPVRLANIPIKIFNINNITKNTHPQTVINGNISIHPEVSKSVTVDNNTGILKLQGPGVGYIPGILSEITKILHLHNININSVITSQIAINLLIDKDVIDNAYHLISKLKLKVLTNILVKKDVSLIAVVGNGMTEAYGVAARILSAVSEQGINIQLSSVGASDAVTYLIVDKKDTDKSLREIHKTLFEQEIQTEINTFIEN